MFKYSDEKLNELSAVHTVKEIESQPTLWDDTFKLYNDRQTKIYDFLEKLKEKHKKIRVIFTGAGTSAYVGETLLPYLIKLEDEHFRFEAIATTDIVSNPKEYFVNMPTLLISFARSGNSPESLEAVNLADELIGDIYHMAITCAPDGKLATNLKDKENACVLLMPSASNDKGFAMTSSFTCMMLTALLIFDKKKTLDEKSKLVQTISGMGRQVINREEELQKIIDLDFDRVVYLGSGVFKGLAREAQLKILELTAGKIATCYDSSMGFRHGPKSFVDSKTLVFDFVSDNSHTQLYDVDIVNEIYHDQVAKLVVAITRDKLPYDFTQFSFDEKIDIEDIYLTFPFIMVAQVISVLASLKVKNLPDTPSANGTVNRVVKGVIIHKL